LLAGRKILLCEDNDINAMIAETILEKSGAKVIRAANGAEAVDAYRKSAEGEISVILMDLRMPVMDGYTAAEQIRKMQRPDAGTIRIIALSAMTMEEDIAKCTQAGMNGFIGKPFEKDELLRKTAGRI
jgi:CheY-like chemotaxis protein